MRQDDARGDDRQDPRPALPPRDEPDDDEDARDEQIRRAGPCATISTSVPAGMSGSGPLSAIQPRTPSCWKSAMSGDDRHDAQQGDRPPPRSHRADSATGCSLTADICHRLAVAGRRDSTLSARRDENGQRPRDDRWPRVGRPDADRHRSRSAARARRRSGHGDTVAPDDPATELVRRGPGPRRPRPGRRRVGPAEDDQVEQAVRRIDRPARSDPARDELAGVRDERQVALDVERLAVGLDAEVGRSRGA